MSWKGGDYTLTLNAQVSADKRLFHVDMLDFDLHIVGLTIRLLCSSKLATRLEEGRRQAGYQLIRHNVSGCGCMHLNVLRTLFLLRG